MRVHAGAVIDKYRADRLGKDVVKEIIKEQLSKKLAYEIFKHTTISEDKWFTIGSTKYSLELEIFTPLEYVQFLNDMQENCRNIIAAGMLTQIEGKE